MTTDTTNNGTAFMEEIKRLDRDLRDASRLLGRKEARYLTDLYYQVQEFRKAAANQTRSGEEEPNRVLEWVYDSTRRLEENIKKTLGEFASEYTVGSWMQGLTGIGPVLSAGFLSHLDVRKAPTAGHFWRFAGLDPSVKWNKGQKRPWNARLKVLCFKLEDCFVKFQNHKNDHYGQLYAERKLYETRRNDSGQNAQVCKYILTGKCEMCSEAREDGALCRSCHGHPDVTPKKFGADTDAKKWYEQGKLPPAHVHARAMRWTGKLFLSHLHHVMHWDQFGVDGPTPFAIGKLKYPHTEFKPVPNWPWEREGKGLAEMGE